MDHAGWSSTDTIASDEFETGNRSPISDATKEVSRAVGRKETLLGRAATLEDVGNTAAFAASDQARSMTAATINVSAGALID
jgi:3-oxoacyl-[acyl-carrier protein] reductase